MSLFSLWFHWYHGIMGRCRIGLCCCLCVCLCVFICDCYSHQITVIYLKELITHSSKDPPSFSWGTKHGLVTKQTELKKFHKHLENTETMQNKHSGIINSKSCWVKLRGFISWQIIKLGQEGRTKNNKCQNFNIVVDIVVQVSI